VTGTLPKTLQHLTGLYFLDLSNNSIGGAIPAAEIRNFTGLETLYLCSNQLSGQVPLLPQDIGHLHEPPVGQEFGSPNLEFLILSSNNIIDRVPASVCRTQNMQFLDLLNNHFEGELPHCSQMQNIAFLLLRLPPTGARVTHILISVVHSTYALRL
jgi:Leucine-rich repeat (LRR) protein